MILRRFVCLVGAAVMLVGVFLPAWEYNYGPVLSSTLTFQRVHFLGTAILILAIVPVVAALLGRCGLLWITGPVSLLVLALVVTIWWSGVTIAAPGPLWPWDPGVRPTRMLAGVPVLFGASVLQIVGAAIGRRRA